MQEKAVGGETRSAVSGLRILARARWQFLGFALLTGLYLTVVPTDSGAYLAVYDVSALVVTIPFAWAVATMSGVQRRPWLLLLMAQLLMIGGDIAYNLTTASSPSTEAVSVSTLLYAVSFVCRVAGLVVLTRRRYPRGASDWMAWVDTALITVALLVIAAVAWSAALNLVAGAPLVDQVEYFTPPVVDIITVGLLIRLTMTSHRNEPALAALLIGQLLILLSDLSFNYEHIALGLAVPLGISHAAWILGYALTAFAAADPRAADLSTPVRADEHGDRSVYGWFAFAAVVAISVPVLGIVRHGLDGLDPMFAIANVVVVSLVVARAALLFAVVQGQARELADLARTDQLTMLPNRRTWDFETLRAVMAAELEHTSLWIGILDIDHFKRFNDAFGHAAGDRLLASAAAAWQPCVPYGGVLARYGGEEFGVLLHDHTKEQALAVLNSMRLATPEGQTLSAGIAEWRAGETPHETLERADAALYEAKDAGRNRVIAANVDPSTPAAGRAIPG